VAGVEEERFRWGREGGKAGKLSGEGRDGGPPVSQATEEMNVTGHATERLGRARRRAVRWGIGILLVLALIAFGYAPVLRGMGVVLIVEDPLEPAAGIVVLGGHLPFRALGAAALYRAGWAPRLVLVRGARREEHQALQALGVVVPDEWELSREVLLRTGVPSSAILLGEGEAADTLEELQIAAKALRPYGAPVILVTSKVHARRVRLTWHSVAGSQSRGIVRTARQDPFDPGRWWKEKRFALAVVREYLGLLNYWAGFPVPARSETGG
jgi:uncharacterized SAM-binding protein YcdF (DUF218 family)